MPIITFENNWDLNFSPLIKSTYKSNYNDTISYGEQLKKCLENLTDSEDQHAIHSANIICQAFQYKSIDAISEIHVLKLKMNEHNNLCLKIAVPHPTYTNECYVGTFILNSAMNMISLYHIETLQRKTTSLPIFKVPGKAWYEFKFDENANPNIPSHSATTAPVKKTSLSASHRTLPISDDLLAAIMANQLSINHTDSGFKP